MLKANDLIYKRIEQHIREQIDGGALHPGDRLLSERKIAHQFNSSVVTVRKAMKPLIDSGIIEKIHGKGTFVKNMSQTVDTGRLAVLYCHSREGLFASSFYMSIISGIEGEAATVKKNMMLRSLIRDPGEDPTEVVRQMARESDGLIIVDPTDPILGRIGRSLQTSPVPVVLVNSVGNDVGLDAVIPDNARDTRTVVGFLAGLGHRRIACIAKQSPLDGAISLNFNERMAAYQHAMHACGLPVDERLTVVFDYNKHENDATLIDPDDLSLFFNYDETLRRFDALFTGREPVTALFCTGDEVALFVYKAARQRGMRIPDDLTVVGYDDMTEAAMVRPALTTLRTPLHEMGAAAVRRVMEKIREKAAGAVTHYRITMPGTLVERKSHKKKA